MTALLPSLLIVAAAAQLSIAALNLFLVRLLGWRGDLLRMPLLLRQVFYVHSWFITITLVIFGVLTLRFAPELSSIALGRWLAGGMGAFWAVRTVLQVSYYSSSHWQGNRGRTLVHITLLVLYGGMAALYLFTAFWR